MLNTGAQRMERAAALTTAQRPAIERQNALKYGWTWLTYRQRVTLIRTVSQHADILDAT